MADADLFARYMSGAALLVSAGSATVSALSYRRSGHRVKASLGTVVSTFDGTNKPVVSWMLRLANWGHSSVQVLEFAFQFDRSPGLHNLEAKSYTGPDLPLQLEGLHTVEWLMAHDDGAWLVDQLGWQPRTVRGIVTLGSGEKIKTSPKKVVEWLSEVDHPQDTGAGLRIYARDDTDDIIPPSVRDTTGERSND
jgi:hypothetical protein